VGEALKLVQFPKEIKLAWAQVGSLQGALDLDVYKKLLQILVLLNAEHLPQNLKLGSLKQLIGGI